MTLRPTSRLGDRRHLRAVPSGDGLGLSGERPQPSGSGHSCRRYRDGRLRRGRPGARLAWRSVGRSVGAVRHARGVVRALLSPSYGVVCWRLHGVLAMKDRLATVGVWSVLPGRPDPAGRRHRVRRNQRLASGDGALPSLLHADMSELTGTTQGHRRRRRRGHRRYRGTGRPGHRCSRFRSGS